MEVRVRFNGYDSGPTPLDPGTQWTEMGVELPFPSEIVVESIRSGVRREERLMVPLTSDASEHQTIIVEVSDAGTALRLGLPMSAPRR